MPKVVITGTSQGIGHHLALKFLANGFDVTGVSRSRTEIDHPAFKSYSADVSDLGSLNAMVDEIDDGSIVGLVNNAGSHGPIGPFESTPIEDWIQAFYPNLFGAATLSQLLIPSLRTNKGFIIFLSGGGSAFPRPNFSAYGVSKTGVVRLSEVLAKELAPDVFVYCVAPGPNQTSLLQEAIDGGEPVPPEDIVGFDFVERLCLFLANNRDSRYSGKFIHVRDSYDDWGDPQLEPEPYTLRRTDPSTLSRINF